MQPSPLQPLLTRRRLLALGAAGATTGMSACARQGEGRATPPPPTIAAPPEAAAPMVAATASTAEPGRLLARPPAGPPQAAAEVGTTPLGLHPERDALLFVPTTYSDERPAPLAVMLHGAGGEAQHGIALLQALADEAGILVLAPASSGRTWDVILGGYGPDVVRIDAALAVVFARYAVDLRRIAVGGFSDGASYALSLGVMNGELFTHIIAFSPGFLAPERQEGLPRVFMAHGTRDEVLPIDRCSRRILPKLEAAGYEVLYREFDGPHTVPEPIAREAVAWFLSET